MALLKPIIHCVIDREPSTFHKNDPVNPTVPFAVNLSFEVPSDGVEEDIADDEAAAESKFLDFLNAVQMVNFHIYRIINKTETPGPPPTVKLKLEHHSFIGRLSEVEPFGNPDDLHGWLKQQNFEMRPYWSTPTRVGDADVAIDADAAVATHRLRAAQGWNAPAAHKFLLTHLLYIPKTIVHSKDIVVLPYFENTPPALVVNGIDIDIAENLYDFDYEPHQVIGAADCRTTFFGESTNASHDLNLPKINSALTADGYLKVDKDAAETHRLLTWFEARAASLMAVNSALNSRKGDPEKDEQFEALFGLFRKEVPQTPDTYYWGSLVWFTVARLVSTLDNFVLGLLKPIQSALGDTAFDRSSEGDILAPLVSLLREKLAVAEAANLNEAALDAEKITAALRSAIGAASPLTALKSAPAKTNADLVRVLRWVFGIDAPKSDSYVADTSELIAEILARYAAGGTETKLPDRAQKFAASIKDVSAVTVARTLLDLEQPLQEEAGAEVAILKLIESAQRPGGPSVVNLIATAFLAEIAHPEPAKALVAVETAVDQALTAYRTLLESPFNGAEATRRASSSAFVRNVLDFAKLPVTGKDSPAVLTETITTSGFYARRLGVGDTTEPVACFDPLVAALVVPDRSFLLSSPDDVRKHLEDAFKYAIAPLTTVNEPDARFIPDSTPQPLAIQISANIDGSKIDEFTKHFNGIAVAIRRQDKGDASDRWAHAHLADLDWTPKKPNTIVPPPARDAKAALHPMLPAVSDGRGAMFIEYEGFPFADAASDARIVDNEEETQDEREKRELFYRHAPHEEIRLPRIFAQVPRLAYGRSFNTFSFITTNAGTLPFALQRQTDPSPWMPRPNFPEPDAALIGEAQYKRRTAIAQMTVVEEVTGAQRSRIGAPVAGVMPLAADYPRVGLKAESGAHAVHDIFRESDGSGRMIVDEISEEAPSPPAKAEWRISEMRYSGVPAKLILRFFDRPARTEDTGTEFTIDQNTVPGFAGLKEVIVRIVHVAAPVPVAPPPPPVRPTFERRIEVFCDGVKLDERVLPGKDALAGWLRLQLEAGAQPVTLTFADPGEQKTDNVAAPLLLLAPSKDALWKNGLADPVTATVSTPRVGYLDFERWFANRDLYAATFDVQPEENTRAARFMKALLTAYMMRHLSPRLAELINQLPDPAVEEVRLELAALDQLSEDELGAAGAKPLLLGDKLKEFVNDPKLELVLGATKEHWNVRELVRDLLEPLNKRFKFKIILAPGTGLSLTDKADADPQQRIFTASIPSGVVARLSLDAMVSAQHFKPTGIHPAVFHDGLTQYAPRQVGALLGFPAAAIRVETMYDDDKLFALPKKNNKPVKHFNKLAVELAGRMITANGIERARRFDLISASAVPPVATESDAQREALTRRWRVLGEIDTTTQRFRPGGRPIYNYVDPRAHRHDGLTAEDEVKHPALRLRLEDDNLALAQFELEAYFDRPDVDAHTVTQRLNPLGARTKLQEQHWNSEAATYFRHRFTLRSRYAGALTQADRREINAWPTDELITTAHGWTHRVAMLADLSRMLLTRPQLRALIPLTTAPGGEDTRAPAPPVAGILQEPPFGRGGLADRIAAEIKTGFGYGFEDIKEAHVEILDSRKEGGIDPHLDYRPLDAGDALGLVLRAEGPIGLTFDSVNAPAPALPNTMILLKPDTLHGSRRNFEEFFAGVALRRYIDPGWTMSSREPQGQLEGERCWWIDATAASAGEHTLLRYTVEDDPNPRMLLTIKIEGERVTLMTSKRAIDGVGSMIESKDPVEVAWIETNRFDGLSVLHQPVAPGRYATAVFVRTQSARTERGEANLPLLVTSFEWSPKKPGHKDDSKPPFVQILRTAETVAYATMASLPTFAKWTRTSRDFDFVHVAFDERGKWNPQPTHVREIVADLQPQHEYLTFRRDGAKAPVWLLPSTFANPFPLQVHRHLGLITSRFLKELGTPAEIFCRTSADPKLQHELVTPQGTVRDPENGGIFRPQEQIVRVVEFETPAAILCPKTQPAVPQTYKQAYFDLVATGFKLGKDKDGKQQGQLRLYFRFVGSPAHVRGFSEITLELWRADEPVEGQQHPLATSKLRVKFENNDTSYAVGLELLLQCKGDELATKTVVRLLRSDGAFKTVTPTATGAPLFELADAGWDHDRRQCNAGLFVAIADALGAGEFWTDVSLLHAPRALDYSPLDLGWLFSTSAGGEPAALVAPVGLTTMVEAQARIISVSPPIPIVSH